MFCKILLLTLLCTFLSAAPTPFGCTSLHQNITLTSFWLLPLSPLAPEQNCYIRFIIPSGFFAVADIIANGIPYTYNAPDIFDIFDDFGNRIEISNPNGTLHSNIAWPTDFTIHFKTSKNTQMTLQMSVSVQKVVKNNVVSTLYTGLNTQPNVLYLNEWKEGTSIMVTSQSNRTQLFSALGLGNGDEFNNIFIYNNGKLLGTMLQPLTRDPFDCKDSILLYMAKQTSVTGVVMAVDHSNIQGLRDFTVIYVPLAAQDQSALIILNSGWDYAPVGVSVIGNHDGSTPIDVRSIFTDGEGEISYLQGGPTGDFSTSALPLQRNKLPLHLVGNINTFYNTEGSANVKITVSS